MNKSNIDIFYQCLKREKVNIEGLIELLEKQKATNWIRLNERSFM